MIKYLNDYGRQEKQQVVAFWPPDVEWPIMLKKSEKNQPTKWPAIESKNVRSSSLMMIINGQSSKLWPADEK